jgi:beta-lactamase superfamily II metal-dependent hydrolase
MEARKWGLDIVYRETIDALEKRNIPIVSDLPDEPFSFGSFTLQFFNTVTDLSKPHAGENVSSVGVKVTKGSRTAFLAADISAEGNLENRIAPLVGKVDLLKIGHHGYTTASNPNFIRTLHPEIAIVTNQLGKIYPNVKWNLVMIAHASIYATVNHNGLIATFTDDGQINLTDKIHDGSAKITVRE